METYMTDDPDVDIVERSDELDKRILAVPADSVFKKSTVVAGFIVLIVIMIVGFGAAYLSLRDVTNSTNEAVRHEIPGLKKQIEDRDQTIEDQTSVIDQATDAILLLITTLQDNGI